MDTARKLARLARGGLTPGGETARVVAVNEPALSCTVETAAGLEMEEVPLRVLNVADDAGMYAVPVEGSDVLLTFDGGDRGRPRVAAVQEFERLVFKKKGGVRVEITRDNKIVLGGKAATHVAVLGDVLLTVMEAVRTHTHPGVTTGPGSTGPAAGITIPKNLTSKVVKIE